MRISDWSSDVCSSDLDRGGRYGSAMTNTVHIIGGGLAGSEAAWQLAQAGVAVILHEMRPVEPTPAHHTSSLAELVCSNSFRSDDADKDRKSTRLNSSH